MSDGMYFGKEETYEMDKKFLEKLESHELVNLCLELWKHLMEATKQEREMNEKIRKQQAELLGLPITRAFELKREIMKTHKEAEDEG